MFSKIVLLALSSAVVGFALEEAPTTAPTSAPTTSPEEPTIPKDTDTSLPPDVSTSEKTDPITSGDVSTSLPPDVSTSEKTDPITSGDVSTSDEISTSKEDSSTMGVDVSSTSSAPVENTTTNATNETKATTTFTTKLKLASAASFDSEKYLEAMAAVSTGGTVEVVSVTYSVSASFKTVEQDVTETEVVKSVANQLEIEESKVSAVVETAARRLGSNGRRLAVTAEVTITSDSASEADGAVSGLGGNNTAALAVELSTVSGKNVEFEVLSSPALTVEVETKITSTTGVAVAAPAADALTTELATALGVPVEVEVDNVVTTGETTTPEEEDSSIEASAATSAKAVVTPVMLFVLAVSSLLA